MKKRGWISFGVLLVAMIVATNVVNAVATPDSTMHHALGHLSYALPGYLVLAYLLRLDRVGELFRVPSKWPRRLVLGGFALYLLGTTIEGVMAGIGAGGIWYVIHEIGFTGYALGALALLVGLVWSVTLRSADEPT